MAVSLSGQGNRLYPMGKSHLLDADIDILATEPSSVAIYVALVSTDYVPQSNDEFYSTAVSIPGYEVSTAALAGSAITTDPSSPDFIVKFDATDLTFSGVAAGSTIDKIVIYKEGTSGVDDYLIGLFMTGSAGPFSVVSNDGDITIAWDSNGIFRL